MSCIKLPAKSYHKDIIPVKKCPNPRQMNWGWQPKIIQWRKTAGISYGDPLEINLRENQSKMILFKLPTYIDAFSYKKVYIVLSFTSTVENTCIIIW